MNEKKRMRLPVLATLLLASTFILGSVTGMFMYATGEEVVTSTFMQMVSHTEYRYGEDGQIIARLVDFQGSAVAVDNCYATILYPDKSFFVNQSLMTATGNITGDHYYMFTTPNGPEGTYEYQATCYYTVGASQRNQSVTNSFHLSGAFNAVLDNLTAQNVQLLEIQGNLTEVDNALIQLSSDLFAVNASLSQDILDLSDQLNTNVSMLYGQADGNYLSLQSQINANVTQILDAIDNITIDVNLTGVYDAIDALELSMANNFTYTNGLINTLSSDMNNNFTVAFSNQQTINATANSIYSLLQNVNATTTNTYQYVTGTLTTKVDNILADLGVINATVNRIELTTNQVNSTVNTILENQENQVYMSVFSG